MSEQKVESIRASFIPYLRPSLAVWQIMKFTPLVGILQGLMNFLLSLLHVPCLSPAYAQLREVRGWVFKDVTCVRLIDDMKPNTSEKPNAGKEPNTSEKPNAGLESTRPSERNKCGWKESTDNMVVDYLGKTIRLEKKGGNKLYVDDKMSHYISDKQWRNICRMKKSCFENVDKLEKDKEKAAAVVFVKGYKRFWEKMITGEVMTFEEALDSVIFGNPVALTSHNVWLLPVNLSAPEEKLVKLLNLVGLFFPHKKVSRFLSRSLSFASALLEFCQPLRLCIYGSINKMFCWSLQGICNKLPYPARRYVYLLGMKVKNLKPRNDIQLKVVKGNINIVIGGAAKTRQEGATQVPWLEYKGDEKKFHCYWPMVIMADYIERERMCKVTLKHNAVAEEHVYVKCKDWEHFMKLCAFLSWVAHTKSGSLKCHDEKKNKVYVRGWRESVRHYIDAGFPPVYTLQLPNVVVS